MKKNHPAPSPSVAELIKQFEQQVPEDQNPEALYAKANKTPRERRPSQQATPEPLYATVKKPPRKQSPQTPPESAYAPQTPPENAYAIPRGGKHPQKPVDPYLVTDLKEAGWLDFEYLENPLYDRENPLYILENPLYDGVGRGADREQHPEKPEHIYAEIDTRESESPHPTQPAESAYSIPRGGKHPQKLVDPYSVTDLKEAGWQEFEHLENPLYDGIGRGADRGRHPEKPEHIYAEIDTRESESPHHTQPPESAYAPQNPPENAYSIPRGGKHPQKLVNPYLVTDLKEGGWQEFEHLENPLYDGIGRGAHRGQHPEKPEHIYAEIDTRESESPHHTQPAESAYAPQKPPENAYAIPRGGKHPQKLVDPYSVTDLKEGGWQESQHLENPLYDGVGGRAHRGQHPEKPEHLYAEIDTRESGSPHHTQPVENADADVNTRGHRRQHQHRPEQSAHAASTSQNKAGPLTNIELAARLAENENIQYCRAEIQRLATIVYGNPGVFEQQISAFLRHPHAGDPISRATAEKPESVSKLAGAQALGIKSPARRQAEDGFRPLCDALERFEHTAHKLAKSMMREHQEKHKDLERGQESPERTRRHHHHHHRAREEQHHSPQREAQQRSRAGGTKGMAFSM
ncbi:BID domain-containing T4SS effector [Bartonella gliris]|uniref:BID domain-containing T4SS effector n=1 Tax=Bartonella gliris TaxID=3004109 RepID=UPI00387395E2